MELYAFGGLRTHAHMLIGVSDVDRLAGFVGYVKSNLAREVGRIADWREKYWGRRSMVKRCCAGWSISDRSQPCLPPHG